jgi:L-lactate dehydrogenase complex protein LldF
MPLLAGINRFKDLCQGETLCGACQDACPVNIDIPRMLLALRAKLADGDPNWNVRRDSIMEKGIYTLWSWIIQNRGVYDLFLRLAGLGQNFLPKNKDMIRRLPSPMSGWTRGRDIRPVAGKSFMDRWRSGEFL